MNGPTEENRISPNAVIIRLVSAKDDVAVLTDLIHQAYARRAADDLRFWGTHQSVEDTATRLQSGVGFVAELDGQLVGTLTLRRPDAHSTVPLYRDADTWSMCQFAVLPKLQSQGIARRLHDAAVEYACQHGARQMAFDTAAPATKLIKLYQRWGYAIVGEVDWRPFTNYISVLMAKSLV